VILVSKTSVKKIGWKILPKDSKRMNPVWTFGILAVRELPYHLRYHSFGLLMPVRDHCKVELLDSFANIGVA
jgi:hypothetical protein